ncbi:MAG: hypothetical protein HZB36_02520 [Candidatus Omnitrophica bacterium]|nr:hypothetical protein [Candidatus Omnitrophota bacterium]
MIDMTRIRETKIKNIIFVAEGGVGKVICSTAVIKRLAEEFPEKKIIVLTGYPDIFLYNPNVYKVFNFGNPLYFYDDYVNSESFVIKVEPYTDYEYMFNVEHIIDTWCKMIGIERKGAMPEIFFLDNEMEAAKAYVDKITQQGKKKFIVMQWIGGIIPQNKDEMALIDAVSRMHRRSLSKSVAQKLANKLVSRDYVVGVIQHENFPDIQGTERLFFPNTPVRGIIALLKFAEGFIGIDSFLHHAATVFGLKGVVIWGGTNPKKLGYEYQRNLTKQACKTPFCHRPDSYVFDSTSIGSIWNCPFNTKCLDYDADDIVSAYEELEKKA